MAYNSWLAVAEIQTRNFSFLVAGGNFDTLKKYVEEAWAIHAKQYDIKPLTYAEIEDQFDVRTYRMYAGAAYRDGELLR